MPEARVRAGFPSPAEDFTVNRLDLTQILVTHPQATFLLRVAGPSMREAGIDDGDTLVVDQAIRPRHGHVVVAVVDGEFTVKYLHQRAGRVKLKAANPTCIGIAPTKTLAKLANHIVKTAERIPGSYRRTREGAGTCS